MFELNCHDIHILKKNTFWKVKNKMNCMCSKAFFFFFSKIPGHKLHVRGQISPMVLKSSNPSTKNTKRVHISANSKHAPARSIWDKNCEATSLSSEHTQI
jgi:hypothetical protein